ncbi:MAG: hypothetical protein GTO18_01140 [Anaerolineales bacterium]|nr:hypothetical protein [Anaerolineales bacterium]
MSSLLSTSEGKFDLIYVDPPFLTGRKYSARIGRNEDSRRPSEWETTKGYKDVWKDPTSYLEMLYHRLQMMHALLAPTGTLYLHLDWHASAYARVLLDEIFGPNALLNEVVWVYHGPSPIRSAFKRKHDTILVYTKSHEYTFNVDDVRIPYNPSTLKTFASSDRAGFGKVPDLQQGKVPEDWWYFPVVARLHKERTGYPTQKPEALLERIILASSNPGDLVGDFFCGSGTTLAVAQRLGRRWVGCDASHLALLTAYRRLLLQVDRSGFEIWESPSQNLEQVLDPAISFKTDNREVTINLSGLNKTESSSHEDIVLWEVDWEFDGKVFQSGTQNLRQWRDDEISLEQSHTYPSSCEATVAVRVFNSEGQFGLVKRTLKIR